jgi:Tol biopolymer transport system component
MNGARIDGFAEGQSVSADGRYIAYVSNASNIVPSEGETGRSVYLWDRTTRTNVRISGFFDGYEFTDDSGSPRISKDGRFLAFRSSTQGEFLGYPRRGRDHVFLWDARTGAMKRISQAADGGDANNDSFPTSVSADGRYVLFTSHASNIVPGDTNDSMDVFMWDGQTGTTTMISRAADGTGADGHSRHASASDDGRYIAYQSEATNIVAGDTNGAPDVFVLDRRTGTTRMTPDALDPSTSGTFLSMITRNGRFVTYVRRGPDAGDGSAAKSDLLLWDLTTDSRDRVTPAADGTNYSFAGGSVSDDGRFVTYSSWASNIVADDTNNDTDVFLWDRSTRSTLMVSRASDGTGLNAESMGAVVSADGRYVTYSSNASNAPDSPSNPYFWANLFSWDRVAASPATDDGPARG